MNLDRLALTVVAIKMGKEAEGPPNYRPSEGANTCASCKHGRSGGVFCSRFNVSVEPQAVCDAFAPHSLTKSFPTPPKPSPGLGAVTPSPGLGKVSHYKRANAQQTTQPPAGVPPVANAAAGNSCRPAQPLVSPQQQAPQQQQQAPPPQQQQAPPPQQAQAPPPPGSFRPSPVSASVQGIASGAAAASHLWPLQKMVAQAP